MQAERKHHTNILKRAVETDVTMLIPHRGTLLRIDQLLYIDDVCARGCFTIKKKDPFLQGETLCEEALIETAAQTVAAAQGWIAQEEGKPNPQGLLIGMESFCFYRQAKIGDTIFVFVEKKIQKSTLLLTSCFLYVGKEQKRLADGVLKFYVS